MPGQWAGSNRKAQLPADWYTRIRPAILERDNHTCTWWEHGRRCEAWATDIDHIGDRHNHSDGNLRALCGRHHSRKSALEGNTARWAVRRQRTPERHPGLK